MRSDTDTWATVDPWWRGFVDSEPVARATDTARALDGRWLSGVWDEVDPWWEVASEVRRRDATELLDLLDSLDRVWKRSESRFDADPLGADWSEGRDVRGPLRPNQEENWSQWLAHLLRGAPDVFVNELFSDCFHGTPTSVRREVHLPDPDGRDRFADVLVLFDEGGISVEVKRNDEHYGKTVHTAGLVERHYPRDWHHVLLLPAYKKPALRDSAGDGFEFRGDGPGTLHSEECGPVSVLHWRTVATALRSVLRRGTIAGPHWVASAYLFCSLVEQKVLGFNPRPVVERAAAADDAVHASRPLSVVAGEVDEQLSYLRAVREDTHE